MPVDKFKFEVIKSRVNDEPVPSVETVNKEEVEGWLQENGHKLNTEEVKYFLKELYDIEEGDCVVVPEIFGCRKYVPSAAEKVIAGDFEFYFYKISGFRLTTNSKVAMKINDMEDPGLHYTGSDLSSGIFFFFIGVDFTVIKN